MLNKSDLSTIIAASNHETENSLWHGEVYTIKQYYDMVNKAYADISDLYQANRDKNKNITLK